jgi:hypothetical protein
MNVPTIYVSPPIIWTEPQLGIAQTEDTNGRFTKFSPRELRAKWDSMLYAYEAAGNEFTMLERQRITTAAELARFSSEVEEREGKVVRVDPK